MKMILPATLTCALSLATLASANPNRQVIFPVIEGEWWRVASSPDLGEYTSDAQEPVDFALWQAADGTWQLWSCIRNTKYPGHGRVFHGWESRDITDTDWEPTGIRMTSKPGLGESEGGLQAPHVVKTAGRYIMAYGDWTNICFAESDDGKSFERIIQADGRTGAFSEGPLANTRDPMMLKVDGQWHIYYTAIKRGKGYGYCRVSGDLKKWGSPFVVSYGGVAGDNPWWNECPHIVEPAPGEFVYFRNQFYGEGNRNWVYYSRNPFNFGIDNDEGLVADLPIAAPEIVKLDGQYYMAALTPELDGIRIARLRWARHAPLGLPVFGFDEPEGRAAWRLVEGNFDFVFTTRPHADFDAVTKHVIGTCEQEAGGFDDRRTGAIESLPFTLDEPQYTLLVGGGRDDQAVYVAIVDATSEAEIVRFAGSDNNALDRLTFTTGDHIGRDVRLKIVDKSEGPWGHINFGGIFRPAKTEIVK